MRQLVHLARLALLIPMLVLTTACEQGVTAPAETVQVKVSHADFWADIDCYSLVVCYRGFTPAEAQEFMMAVGGGSSSSGLTAYEVAQCDALYNQLMQMKNRGDAGIWTDVYGGWDAVTNWSSPGDARSATHAAHAGNSFLWYHEAAHVVFNSFDETVADYWGNKCQRA